MSSQLESELAHADILYPELVREVKRLRAREAALVAALEEQILPRAKGWKVTDWGIRDEHARAALAGQED